jgi:hypothetical protein
VLWLVPQADIFRQRNGQRFVRPWHKALQEVWFPLRKVAVLNRASLPGSAGLSGDMELAYKMFAAAIVGGCVSVVGGGKFETGAVTGAFVAMITSSLENYLTEQGEPVYADGKPQDPAAYPKGTDVVNSGVGTSKASFQLDINAAAKIAPTVGFYNPTNGAVSDVLQAAWQKVLFGVGDSLAISAGQFSQQFNSPNVVGYSQGGLTVANAALRGLLPKGSTMEFRSSAASTLRGELSGRIHGINPTHDTPWGDIISAAAPNPVKMVTAPIDIVGGFSIHRGNR